MTLRPFSSILAASLLLIACSQTVNQTANIMLNQNNGANRGGFSALGGVSLDPTVEMFCANKSFEGDQGYARSLQRQYRQYINQLLGQTEGGNQGNSGSIYGGQVQPSSGPTAAPTTAPTTEPTTAPSTAPTAVATATSDISVVEKTTFNGKIFDLDGVPLTGATIEVRSLNSSVPYEAATTTIGGAYAFNNAPAGVQLEIVATIPGYAPRRRIEVLKSNKQGDPHANRFDFGTDGSETTEFGQNYNGLSDAPEIVSVLPARNATGIQADTRVELTFSEPMNRESVEQAFALYKQGSTEVAFDISDFEVSWNADHSKLSLSFKPGVQFEAHQGYQISFKPGTVIKDEAGTGRDSQYFKLTDGNYEADSKFNVLRFLLAQNGPLATPSPEPTPLPPATQERDFYYFSYDDSASLAGVELTKYALENGRVPEPQWARTWEFLNYENFDHNKQQDYKNFKISLGLWKHPNPANSHLESYEIGAHVTAPYQCLETRRNLNLTIVLDISGSMNEPASSGSSENASKPVSKMELAKAGLKDLQASLKKGDVINLIVFSNKPILEVDNYLVGSDPASKYLETVEQLQAEGNTNLQLAIDEAYRLAQRGFDRQKMNRVLLMTDAQPTEGTLDIQLIEQKAASHDAASIQLSALGMGHTHNQSLLNQITEAGRGAYFTIQTRADMRQAIRDRFIPLMDVIARSVRFKLEFPGWLRHGKSAAEQVSSDPSQVMPTNFSANTSQFFWEQFDANLGDYQGHEKVKLTMSYQDPLTRNFDQIVVEKPLSEMLNQDVANIQAAHMIQLTTSIIKKEMNANQVNLELNSILKGVGQ